VVEDDYLLRSYMVETLRDLGYHVIAAADATGALGFLDHPAIRIDMMLTDVVMRGMNVRELAEQARRVDKDVDLLQKPITQAQLSTRIREVLDRR
jgi:CheY-like chemotaxis protein